MFLSKPFPIVPSHSPLTRVTTEGKRRTRRCRCHHPIQTIPPPRSGRLGQHIYVTPWRGPRRIFCARHSMTIARPSPARRKHENSPGYRTRDNSPGNWKPEYSPSRLLVEAANFNHCCFRIHDPTSTTLRHIIVHRTRRTESYISLPDPTLEIGRFRPIRGWSRTRWGKIGGEDNSLPEGLLIEPGKVDGCSAIRFECIWQCGTRRDWIGGRAAPILEWHSEST